jgi:hypothetical protein
VQGRYKPRSRIQVFSEFSFCSALLSYSVLSSSYPETIFSIMGFRQYVMLLSLFMAAADSLPNLLNDWDSQILNTGNIALSELGSQDTDLSRSDDHYLWDTNSDEKLAFTDPGLNPQLLDSKSGGAISSVFLDWTETESSPTLPLLGNSDVIPSNPGTDNENKLAMDDICPLGYWNRCCNGDACFWCRFGSNSEKVVIDNDTAPTPVLNAICPETQLWCCFDRPVSFFHRQLLDLNWNGLSQKLIPRRSQSLN